MQSIEGKILEEITRSRKLPSSVVKRSKVIILYTCNQNKKEVSTLLASTRDYVYTWLNRWESMQIFREKWHKDYTEGNLSRKDYKKEILKIFKDKPRSGCPAKFSQLDKDKIVALASESPENLDLPFTHWTLSILRIEIMNRNIVNSISTAQVGRILKNKQVATTSSRILGTPEYR